MKKQAQEKQKVIKCPVQTCFPLLYLFYYLFASSLAFIEILLSKAMFRQMKVIKLLACHFET